MLEEIEKIKKDEKGLTNSDNKQLEIIHEIFFSDIDIEDFKQKLAKVSDNSRYQFLNGCFFLKGAMELKSDYCESIKVAMLFTAIEAIMGVENYVTFDAWVISKEAKGITERDKILADINFKNFGEKMKKISKIYFKNYGVIEHVRKFFKEYFSIGDKKKIILAFKIENRKGKEPILMHKCYQDIDKCLKCEYTEKINKFRCKQKRDFCVLFKTEEEINKVLDTTISDLYQIFRNEIIHRGNRSNILTPHIIKGAFCAGNSLFLSFKKNKDVRYARINDDLNHDNFAKLILKGIKAYYNSL